MLWQKARKSLNSEVEKSNTEAASMDTTPLEMAMTTHSSILAWRITWTEEAGGLQSTGLQRVRHKELALQCIPLGNQGQFEHQKIITI